MKELLDWVEKKRPKMHLGARGLLHIAQTYKQRFQFRAQFRDPRWFSLSPYLGIGRPRPSPGIADRLEDSSIATEWISRYPSNELVGKYATFEGRPVIGIDKAPPRLYHRTLKDAAFNILQEGMMAGYGNSGNLTITLPRRALRNWGRAGVRADHPVEIVLDTSIVASECWLFKTRSEGICTRDRVPRAAILYIRDTRSDEMLYSASADAPKSPKDEAAQDDEEADEEMERRARGR